MLEAKSTLSKLVQAVEEGRQHEVIIARNGRPAAKLVPLHKSPDDGPRLGVASGRFVVPDDIDRTNPQIKALFMQTRSIVCWSRKR